MIASAVAPFPQRSSFETILFSGLFIITTHLHVLTEVLTVEVLCLVTLVHQVFDNVHGGTVGVQGIVEHDRLQHIVTGHVF